MQRDERAAFLLNLFGPSKWVIWEKLAKEIGARHEYGGFWSGRDVVVADVGQWRVVLDVVHHDKVCFTRLRAPYVNADGFRFLIFRKHLFSGLADALGFQDVAVGHREFDEAFIIRGNDESRLRRLFDNPRLRELLMAQPKVLFKVIDDEGFFRPRFPNGVDELRFQVPGVIKDLPRLKALYELFSETLHQLCVIGSAYDHDPGVKL
jgi:hypothetical protein